MTTPTTGHHGRHTPAHTRVGRLTHAGHGWMMLACCLPMVAVVVLLLVSGGAGTGVLGWALACVAMMAAMMLMMPSDHDPR